jgi:hypothetical protein
MKKKIDLSASRCTRAASRRPKPMLDAGYEAAQNRVDLMLKAAKPDDGPWLKLL